MVGGVEHALFSEELRSPRGSRRKSDRLNLHARHNTKLKSGNLSQSAIAGYPVSCCVCFDFPWF